MYNIVYGSITVSQLFRSAYHKSTEIFFGFSRSDSITIILLLLKLPSFGTCAQCFYVSSYSTYKGIHTSVIQYLNLMLT